jgi:hypothetical protein
MRLRPRVNALPRMVVLLCETADARHFFSTTTDTRVKVLFRGAGNALEE